MDQSQLRAAALNHYRRLVALLYREIGVLRERNHPDVARRANQKDSLFSSQSRKQRAKDIYRLTLATTDPAQIASQYQTRSGLSLQDIHDAFADGQWQSGNGHYSFGGPRWARIAEATITLGNALQQQAWNNLPALIATIQTLEHNNGRITDKYEQLD